MPPMDNDNKQITPLKQKINEIGLGVRASAVIEYVFDNPYKTQDEIGKHFGISQNRVSKIMRHPRVRAAFPVLARRKLQSFVPQAVGTLGQLMSKSRNDETRRKVASDVLKNEKILSDNAPSVVVNQFAMMRSEELIDAVNRAKGLSAPIIEGEVVGEDGKE